MSVRFFRLLHLTGSFSRTALRVHLPVNSQNTKFQHVYTRCFATSSSSASKLLSPSSLQHLSSPFISTRTQLIYTRTFSSTPKSTSQATKTIPPRPPPNNPRSAERIAEIRRRNNNLLAWALALVLGTVGLSYASVPLYRVFCQVTGFGGTVRTPPKGKKNTNTLPTTKLNTNVVDNDDDDDDDVPLIDETRIVEGRPLTIRFNADVSATVPWRFIPQQSEVTVLPGEAVLAFYYAENKSEQPITGIATYNVTPAKAAIYFNKVQCFCFDEQRLKPGEGLDMPVFFYIDPDFADDEDMKDIKDLILSYTFFKAEDVTPEQLVKAQAIALGHK